MTLVMTHKVGHIVVLLNVSRASQVSKTRDAFTSECVFTIFVSLEELGQTMKYPSRKLF